MLSISPQRQAALAIHQWLFRRVQVEVASSPHDRGVGGDHCTAGDRNAVKAQDSQGPRNA